MPNLIERIGNVWFARLDVPAKLRHAVGKRVLRKTLKTSDRPTAQIRAAIVVAQ
jgi:hypothetical protein